MPILNWIGKDKVQNHHLDVPFHTLDKQYTVGDSDSENKIINGDNLIALKALLPEYEGRIKCIYIDPPYNTGNEGWVYNDNVNSPQIKRWLGEVVGKEGEDLSRHDKWLCMMYPRLQLLHKLLADDGAIFISIDDNEQANLKLICDEIFGAGNFVANISWQRTYSIRNDSKGIPVEVEHILVYIKKMGWQPRKLGRTAEMDSLYKNPDNDKEAWTSSSCTAPGASTHQGMVYGIQHPFSGEIMYPSTGRHWSLGQEYMFNYMNEWCEYELKDINDENKRALICGVEVEKIKKGIKAIVLKNPLDISQNKAREIIKNGPWPYFYFTNNGKGGLRRKTYISEVGGRISTNFFNYEETGHTDEAQKEIIKIFNGNAIFSTPKPTRLIERILQIASDKDSIILDSFAGSGTTAHAVLNLNKKDGGNRKFILVEMEDYAETITAERMKRVINGYGEGDKAVEGTGGGFDYFSLGKTIFNTDGNLNEEIGVDKIREYIWYSETGNSLPSNANSDYFLGSRNATDYYFYYEPNEETILTRENIGEIVKQKAETYIIYADACQIEKSFMDTNNIIFKRIPRDIKKL